MATAKEILLRLALKIDPTRQDTGEEFTMSTIGVYDGDGFPKQRILDIYNSARRAVIPLIDDGWVIASGVLMFSVSGGVATAVKPSGYQDWVSVSGAHIIDNGLVNEVRGASLDYIQSASIRYLFDLNDAFIHYGLFIADGEEIPIIYKTISTFTLANIADDAVENIPEKYHERLLSIATAVSKGLGDLEVAAFSNELLKGRA